MDLRERFSRVQYTYLYRYPQREQQTTSTPLKPNGQEQNFLWGHIKQNCRPTYISVIAGPTRKNSIRLALYEQYQKRQADARRRRVLGRFVTESRPQH